MSNVNADLMHEHRAIERVIDLLERARGKIETGQPVPPSALADALDFLRNFADKCHHAKEEGALFPAMAKKGVPVEGGPIGVMLIEHEQGRRYVRSMAEALPAYEKGDPAAATALAGNIRGYAELLRQHIQKEDTVLYPLADRVLAEADKAALVEEYERVEREVAGPGEHEKHLEMIDKLAAAVA